MTEDRQNSEIELDLRETPFAFDQNETIRCLKCHDAGWTIDGGTKAGLDWETKQTFDPPKQGSQYQIPDGWSRNGTYDRERLDIEAWKQMVNESWRQIRHLGKQRLAYHGLWGTASLLGVIFMITGEGFANWIKSLVLGMLAIYSIYQGLMVLKMSKAYRHNMEHIDLLAAVAPESANASSFGMLRSMRGMIVFNRWSGLQLSWLGPRFFAGLAVLWVMLSGYFGLLALCSWLASFLLFLCG